MKAMILAAGLGTRMRPLTLTTPKPLIEVAGKPLIQWHIERLVTAGITDLVINHAWLGAQIESFLGTGKQFGCAITYSAEASPLETGGGILRALPQLIGSMNDLFLVVNADVFCDVDFSGFISLPIQQQDLGALLMVENPEWHSSGDFMFAENTGYLHANQGIAYTYSGISVLRGRLFEGCADGVFGLAPLLRQAIAQECLRGSLHTGYWSDIGTPERLHRLNEQLRLGEVR